ncbi:MAG: dienelactone hydrolase [Candidatus Muproteobacteria bacterium RBG_16_62_13]|uniref:Dienelactone hydrolase n=1 Tax=Candidatus Muproteobacteria bacterium RBG_16_62_13 TaxID=1817756 RepID=A0A1F6T4Z0_9PROT|nr:MAG: dienelactone hydrolase [Candidatus Muproteobacteria bacterium RBG_16_62_13]
MRSLFRVLILGAGLGFSLTALGGDMEAGPKAWWWDEGWWSRGQLAGEQNHEVTATRTVVKHGDVDVPVHVFRPKGAGPFPGILFVHGRRGIDVWNQLSARRLAARGFIVFAPDLYSGRIINQFPIKHDYEVEGDLGAVLDAMLKHKDLKGSRICSVGISRGGYYALKLAVAQGRQGKGIACYVGFYPTMQDPNAPEPAQVYQYAPEVDKFQLPALVFIGDQEQYHRRRSIEASVSSWQTRQLNARLIIYPGVGRGFDFRGGEVRSFADNLAGQDAVRRTANFVRQHLGVR